MTGAITDKPIQLDSISRGRTTEAQSLPGMAVSASAKPFNYRLVDFERRRQTGRGQYLTEDEIVKSGAYTVADAVKGMRGVLYECGGGAGCYVRMSNAPMRCLPEFIVDNQVMNDFGPSTPIRDIIGLEVYTGPSEVPGEYAGRYAGCGVVVIWTRSGPTKKQRQLNERRVESFGNDNFLFARQRMATAFSAPPGQCTINESAPSGRARTVVGASTDQ